MKCVSARAAVEGRKAMAVNGSGNSGRHLGGKMDISRDSGGVMRESEEWPNRMMRVVSSVREGVEGMTFPRSKQRFRIMVLLHQIESQIKFGEFYSEKDVEFMVEELTCIVRSLDVSREQQSTLTADIRHMAELYFKRPKTEPAAVPHFVLFGETGVGKSTLGNTFLGKQCFETSSSGSSCTTNIRSCSGKWLNENKEVVVVDTPGVNDAEMEDLHHIQNLEKTLKELQYVSAFVLVFSSCQTRITRTHHNMIKLLRAIFGTDFFINACVMFTNWSASAAAQERRRRLRNGEKQMAVQVNSLLRQQFEFDFDLPCFFVDSIEFEIDINAEAHLASLDKFYNTASNLLPYYTLNLADMEQKMQEMRQILSSQSECIQAYKEQVTAPAQIKEIDEALRNIQDLQDEQRTAVFTNTTEGRDCHQEAVEPVGLDAAIERVKSFKSKTRKWRVVAKALATVCDFSILAERAVSYDKKHYIRNGRMALEFAIGVGNAMTDYLETQYE